MPKEASSKAPNRWEGTQTYPRNTLPRKRTVAQIREETIERIKADREKRRIGVEKLRRNSIAALPEREAEEQEEEFFDAGDEMPGSGKKKKNNSPSKETAPMEQGADGVDPAMLALLMSIKQDINNTTNTAVGKVNDRIDENAVAIQKIGRDTADEVRKLRVHVEETQAGLEDKIMGKIEERDIEIQRRLSSLENRKAITVKIPDHAPRNAEPYNKARRSLKIWPIKGPDLEDSLMVFMKTKLQVEDEKIRSLGPVSIKHSVGRGAKDRDEVLVQFDCREDRDYVKSMGFNLAGDKSTGMSIHVPGHLLDNFYALNSIGYNIRHNQEGVKRSVKFDDIKQDIFLDIYIGGNWKRILPEEAKTALKRAPGDQSGSGGSRSIQADDLVSLIRGENVPGLTTVVVPPDEESATDRE